MEERKNFASGGLDQDSGKEFIAKNDYISAFNIRVTGVGLGEAGLVTNIESNELISGERSSGINKAIGAVPFESIRKAISIIYNSQGYHQVIEIDYDLETQTVLFTNKTDSGGEDILPLNPQYYVNDLKLIGDTYLVFTDNNMQPCYINLHRLREGDYGTLTADDFLLIKAQILVPPTAIYNDDGTRSVNLLSGNLFQFRTQIVYLDNEFSAWSSISKRPVPTSEGTPIIGTDVTKNNNLIVRTGIGTNRVKRVIVSARVGNSDWFTISDKSREDIIALLDATVDVSNEIDEAYDPSTGLYSFAFYNDGLYNNIDVLETDLLADYVPLKAGTLEILNGNVLAVADCTEGYERPNPSVTLSVSSYQPDITIENPDASTSLNVSYDQYRPKFRSYQEVTLKFTGVAKTGDQMALVVGNLDGAVYYTLTYEVPPEADENTLEAARGLAAKITQPTNVYQSGSVVYLHFPTRGDGETPDGNREKVLNFTRDLANAGTGASKSVSSLKTNSSYQLSLAHYDKWGRPYPIATGDNYVIKTLSYSQLKGAAPLLNWQINSTAPEGAVSAQWLMSKNTTHESTLYVVAKIASSTTQYINLNINSLKEFNEGNDASILEYDFSEGDRCTLHYYDNSGSIVWLTTPSIDTEVIGFEIKVDTAPEPDVTNYLLKVRRSSQLEVASVTGKNILLEIYTPRKRVITGSDGEVSVAPTLFYEVGEQINIVNGEYETTSGQITEGDAFFKTRQLENAVDATLEVYEVESFHFSDFYISNYTSYGRPRSYYDVKERIERKASIRYSDVFRLDSEVNGITRFYPERLYGEGDGETSSNNGAIEKIVQRDNTLITIQSLKVGHIPIFQSILEDQTAQQNVSISDKILDKIRYVQSGIYGMGGAKESFAQSRNGTVYFIDFNNSIPVRDGYNGVQVIAGKMGKYFRQTFQQAKKDGKKIIGWFDEYNQEYVCAIEQDGDIVQYYPFNNSNWRSTATYNISPSTISLTSTPTKGNVSINTTTGIATYTPNLDELGSDNFTFTFMDGATPVTKRACIVITEGNSDVFDFVFGDLIGKELSTTYTSNSILIGGNDIPSPISITGGEYQITRDGVALGWTSASGYVNENDVVQVRQVTSASYETTTNTTLTVGNQSDIFSVTTRDNTPDVFTFIDVTGAFLSTLYISNTITITGTTGTLPVSIIGGEYSKNGGAYTSADGTAVENDTFTVRQTSSESNLTATNTTLTVGNTSDTYTVTTEDTVVIACGAASSYSGGEAFPIEETITLGSDIGTVTLTFDAIGVPDKFEVWFDGVKVIDTGYRGNTSEQAALDAALAARSLPPETITSPGNGTSSFIKSTATATAIVKVYAPMSGTSWDYTLSCPDYDTYNATVYSESTLPCTMEVYDDTTGILVLTTAVPATATTGPTAFNVIPDASTLTVKLLGADFSTEDITFLRNGFAVTPAIVGTTYTFTGFAKETFELLINNGA